MLILRRVFTFFGYLGLALLVVVFTFVLVAYGKDYSYDFRAHKIIQKGHVIIDSVPGGAVSADGKPLKKNTPYQAAYTVGQHNFQVLKDGFWPWQKMLEVTAGRVELATYVLLIPKKPAQTVLDTRPAIAASDRSRDHHHLVYVTAGADAAVYTLDVGNHKVARVYQPQAATPTTPAETLHAATWSDDASHLIVASDLGGTPQFRLVPAAGGEGVNLTQAYGFDLSGLTFSGWNWHQMFWISSDGLRKLDVDTQSVSGVLADKVTQFWMEPDRVLYVQQTDLGRSLWSIDSHGKRQELVQVLAESDKYAVALSRYSGQDVLAVVPAKTGVATLYSDIYGDTPESKVVAKGVSGASFSPSGQFLALTGGSALQVYDLERASVEQKLVVYNAPGYGDAATFSWFDGFHILINQGGQVRIAEFDGQNSVALGSAYNTFGGLSTYDQHGVLIFEPATSGAGVSIVQVQIR
ncbi:MAG TPA: hypothetical protein VHQ86_02965 [Candidatus Saccharimonadia bacterium]|nr:hypothetical protein [Candidatus Saccharimonadia bacterium]